MKESIKRALKSFMVFLNQGKTPYVACCGLIVLSTILVYFSPRSIPAFLLFVFSASSIYWLKLNRAVQLALAVLFAVVLVPILGAVSMDLTTIDLTGCPSIGPGDAVTLLGSEGEASIDAQQMARTAGTISYDVLCGIRTRVARVYV